MLLLTRLTRWSCGAGSDGLPRHALAGVALAVLLTGLPPGAAGAAPAAAPALTTRAELGSAGVALRARLLQRAEWGRGLAVMAAGDAVDSPLAVVLGLETAGALVGPVATTGAWRELVDPLGFDAGSGVFAEASGLRLHSGINPGSWRGVQLSPGPELAVAGFRRLARAGAGGEPPIIGMVTSLAAHAALQIEAYAALRTDAPRQAPPGWVLEAAPFPGGVLSLAGARVGLSAAGADLWASANLSGGPRVPVAAHARLAVRGDLDFGELRAMIAAAGREFRGLTGNAVPAPLAWAVQLRGDLGAPAWTLKYRVSARGEELASVLRPTAGGESAQREVEVAVTPVVPVAGWTLSATGNLAAGAGGVVLSAGARLDGAPGELAVTWRGGGSGSRLRVRGAVTVAPVTVEAGVTAAGAATTAELAIGLRTPELALRVALRKLGQAPPAGPVVTVTFAAPA